MPEYVYALHNFVPEHEDEIAFDAGQPIEVIEKDDQYNDGWWQVSTPFHFPNTPHMCALRTRGHSPVVCVSPQTPRRPSAALIRPHPRCH